jgi:lactate permease
MLALLAALPILAILVLMLGLRWSAAKAGLSGLGLTLLIAYLAFGYGTRVLPELGALQAGAGALTEAALIALTILWIIFPALCIHELQLATGAVEQLRRALRRLSDDPRVLALLVAWFFTLFLEGAAGFGTPIALAAPFLVSAGFKRVEAVTIALIGHAAGVSFGAIGTPILPQLAVTPYTGLELSQATAIYHALLAWIMPVIVVVLVSRSVEKPVTARLWLLTILAAGSFILPYFLIAQFVGPELPTLAGALIGAVIFIMLLIQLKRREGGRDPTEALPQRPITLLLAAAPYLVVVALVVLTRLIPTVQQNLRAITLEWRYGAIFSASIQPLYHPGTILLLGFLLGGVFQNAGAKTTRLAAGKALKQLMPVTLALFAMLGLSRLMVHSQMIATLAETSAQLLSGTWPLFAPFIGTLGTFVTGSATASNILFSDFQLATATALELAPLPLLGAQGFGAAVGNIICPHNIIAASATVALVGEEGTVLKRTLWVALLYAALGGLLALFVFT